MNKHIYLVIGILLVLMIIYIEINLNKDYAPESILIKVVDKNNQSDRGATCFADIVSDQVNEEDKPLETLYSLYDLFDASIFYSDKGDDEFQVLYTEFDKYQGEFEVRIVCYSQGYKGVSYTIINNSNQNCEISDNGKVLFC